MKLNSILNKNFKQKKILLRVDFNVPLRSTKITDDTKIKESLPTIKYLLQNQNSLIITSHLGRPKNKNDKQLSLKPIAKKLQKLLNKKVIFINSELNQDTINQIQNIQNGEIYLLENIRFNIGEEKNNSVFSKKLASIADVFVNDAFASSHRIHSSVYGVTKYLPSYAGLLLQKEFDQLNKFIGKIKEPVTFIIGGSKIDTKINLIESFVKRTNNFLIGGGLANTFLASKKYQLANSFYQKNKIKTAKSIISLIHQNRKNLYLPEDFIIAKKLSNFTLTKNTNSKNIPDNYSIYDIGTKSTKEFCNIIKHSKTIIFNGPVGVTEFKPFRNGTKKILLAMKKATQSGATTLIGGGDTLEALKLFKINPKGFTHISTGGGAMLEFLEKNGKIPGIEVLIKK